MNSGWKVNPLMGKFFNRPPGLGAVISILRDPDRPHGVFFFSESHPVHLLIKNEPY